VKCSGVNEAVLYGLISIYLF